jgi:hypothetical protein
MAANLSTPGRSDETTVYRRPWRPLVILVGAFLAVGIVVTILQPAGGAGVLVVMVVLGAGLLGWNARSRVITSKEGVTVMPFLGRSKHYPWSEVNGFSVGRIPGGRYGGPVVSMSITDRSVLLRPTLVRDGARGFVERTCDALNHDLERFTGRRRAG